MKPGDLRPISKQRDWGECYVCRHLFPLDDLSPVHSADSEDWRFICPLCKDVAKCTRPPQQQRALIWERLSK